ncbi:MAG: acyl-[acyl-carrier-protein]--UDP-N-acetylglucosamine O-acyltransferase, partial [Candidatus Omnitrophota bacterium]
KIISDLKIAFKILFFLGLNKASAVEKARKDIPQSPEAAYLLDFINSSSRGVARANRAPQEESL